MSRLSRPAHRRLDLKRVIERVRRARAVIGAFARAHGRRSAFIRAALPTDGELSGTARRARGPRFERAHGDDERDDAIFATAEFLQHGDARRGVGTGGVRDCAAARRGEAPRVLQARRSRRARASTHIANGSMSMKDARALCGGVGPGDGGAPKGSS